MNDNVLDYDIFIKGTLVNLVVLTEEIVEKTNWYNWFNDEDTTANMQQHYFPNTKAIQLEFFKSEIEKSDTKLQLGVVLIDNNLFCGVISLNNIDYINRCCEISAIMGEKSSRKIQYFIEAAKLIIKHGFNTLNMNRIYSGTIAKEIDELLCKTLGFKHEGISRQAIFKSGKYYDIHYHSLIKQDYELKND